MSVFECNYPKYKMYTNGAGKTVCVRSNFRMEDFVEISTIDHPWAKFLNLTTGQVVDCFDVHKEMLDEIKNS